MPAYFFYGEDELTVSKAMAIANGSLTGTFNESTRKKILASQEHVANIVKANKTVYGINTGFGALANTKISEADTITLQYKILQSHSVGVGNMIPTQIAKLMMILKVQALSKGLNKRQK